MTSFPPHKLVFYVSFVITPICSNASELVSSLIFAAKRKKINSSMTFSQVRIHHHVQSFLIGLSLALMVTTQSGAHLYFALLTQHTHKLHLKFYPSPSLFYNTPPVVTLTAIWSCHYEQHPCSGSICCSGLLQGPGLAVLCW